MSRPRYKWWSYVKWCVRDYPDKCAQQRGGTPFTGQRRREYEGVLRAVEETRALPDGEDMLRLVELVFWRRSHSLAGAAMRCRVSERTAERWHTAFVRRTARHMGLLDEE